MKLIYIMGSGRSGSTLLDIMIGSQSGVFSSGELCNLVTAYFQDEYCACGKKICECEIWHQVIESWQKKNKLNKESMLAFAKQDKQYSHPKKISSWLLGLLPMFTKSYQRYIDLLGSLYHEVSIATGESTLTDSSKSPVRLLHIVRAFSGFVQPVHLVKSPYGIIASLRRGHKKNMEAGIQHDLPARSAIRSALYWVVINFMVEFACKVTDHNAARYKYEDLISQSEISLPNGVLFFRYTKMAPGHVCAGNRMRMLSSIELREPNFNQAIKNNHFVDVLTYLSRRRYGY